MSTTDKRQSASRTGLLRTDPRTSSTIRDKLGEELRAMYGKLEEEPPPDRLLYLVRQLEQPLFREKAMTLPPDLRDGLLQAIPSLRAFAISLTGNIDQADDLVQEAMVRGLTYINQFQPGTNIQAWLFTILRNQFHTFYRKRRREVEDPDGGTAARLAVPPEQDGHVDLEDLKAALAQLPIDQREALLLVGPQGFSYEEASAICGARIGTIKSRVNRART